MQFVRLLHKLQGVSSDSLSGNFLVDDKGMFIMDSDGKLIEVSTLSPVEPGLVYHTNFGKFDTNTGLDIPLVGSARTWDLNGNSPTMETITIDGEDYFALHANPGAWYIFANDVCEEFGDTVSVEFTTYKPIYTGYWGGTITYGVECPGYNCWSGGRGIIIERSGIAVDQRFNGFQNAFDSSDTAEFYNPTEIAKIAYGGCTVIKSQNLVKVYMYDKKAMVGRYTSSDTSTAIYAYSGGWGTQDYYVLDMKVYADRDRFEEMEG